MLLELSFCYSICYPQSTAQMSIHYRPANHYLLPCQAGVVRWIPLTRFQRLSLARGSRSPWRHLHASKYKEQQPLNKPKPARALGVASEDSGSDSDTQVKEAEEELCFTVAQG
jgi:hypothetical protein